MTMTIVSPTDARLFRDWPASAAAFEHQPDGDLLLVVGADAPADALGRLAARFGAPVDALERFRIAARA